MSERCLLPVVLALLPGPLLAGAGCALETGPAAPGAAAAPVGAAAVSDEIAVSLPTLQPPVTGRWPAAAFDGEQFLVVWEDLRAGWPILYGARVDLDGVAREPLGFPILDASLYDTNCCAYEPSVAFDGQNFLVVVEAAGRILGVRVSPAGEVLDPDGIEIAAAAVDVSRPALAFDGQQYMVAWSQGELDTSPNAYVYWARVRPDGTVLDPGGVRGYAVADVNWPVGLSFDGSQYLLTWLGWDPSFEVRFVYVARVAPDGTRIDTGAIRISPDDANVFAGPVAGFDGANHVIAWAAAFPGDPIASPRVMLTRVTPARGVLDPGGILIATPERPAGMFLDRLSVAAGGFRSAVTWSMDALFYFDPAHEPVGATVVMADGTFSLQPADAFARGAQATAVAHPDGALLLWREQTEVFPDQPSIMSARLDAAGAPEAGRAVVPGLTATGQRVIGVATDGQIYFVAWTDPRDPEAGGRALYGARIAADGTPLEPEGILLTTSHVHAASVMFDGANFVIAWGHFVEDSAARAVRVRPDGVRLDAAPWLLPVSWPRFDFAAASDGTHLLLAGPDDPDYLGIVLLDQNGEAASEVAFPELERRFFSPGSPAVSFDGTGYLVVWHQQTHVFGQLVDVDGALLGQPFVIAGEDRTYHCTRVAAGGGTHLVVWQDEAGDIVATPVSPDGEVLDPAGTLITQGADTSATSCPPVVFDGKRFVVAWRAPSLAGEDALDLYGAELDPDGALLRQYAIAEDPEREGPPFLAAGADGQALAAYNRFAPGEPYEAQRAQVRLIGSGVVPEPGADAGPPGADPGPGDGCGCRVGADQPAPWASLLLFGVVALMLVRRRRAR